MPQLNGLYAARHLKRSLPKAKLVFMTMNEEPDLVGEAFGRSFGILVEAWGGNRIDTGNRQSPEGQFIRNAQSRAGAGEYRFEGAGS